MKRKIIEINEEKCNGCGLCATACHEGAIKIIGGKAKLVSDAYCDGLGDCLPACPMDAIHMIEREAVPYDEAAVKLSLEKRRKEPLACGCPGTMEKRIERKEKETMTEVLQTRPSEGRSSALQQWPVQLKLVNPDASYLKKANLLLAADCTAFAHGDFHNRFIKGKVALIGCPKLDDAGYYKEKMKEILLRNDIRSLEVVRMSVPCCGGMANIAKQAMLETGIIVPYSEVVIDTDGSVL